MDELYPVTIVYDRYSGTYSGAKWLAFNMYPENVSILDVNGDDISCHNFWLDDAKRYVIGKGSTPDEALADLYSQTKHRV
jgi:hypothetical protein